MVLSLKTWKSRSLPGLPRTDGPRHDERKCDATAPHATTESRRGNPAAAFFFCARAAKMLAQHGGLAPCRRHSPNAAQAHGLSTPDVSDADDLFRRASAACRRGGLAEGIELARRA